MTTGIVLTGKRGDGKTLAAVARARDYLRAGRRVATNLDLMIDRLLVPDNKTARVYRLPDHPVLADLEALPRGNDTKDEQRNGLMIIDEAATILNSRTWSDNVRDRQAIIGWFLHSRKYGWDLIFISQHVSLLDKQMRDALFELHGVCKRLDKVAVPVLTGLAKHFDLDVKMPKVHVAIIRYGMQGDSPISEKWWYRGHDLYQAYDTNQIIDPHNGIGLHCLLTPWHLRGRFLSRWEMYGKVMFSGLLLGLVVGAFATGLAGKVMGYKRFSSGVQAIKPETDVKVSGYSVFDGQFIVSLTDGRVVPTTEYNAEDGAMRFKVGQKWYEFPRGAR